MHCNRCGYENPDENYYCGHCGMFLRQHQDLGVEPDSYARSEQETEADEPLEPQSHSDGYAEHAPLTPLSAWAQSHAPGSRATGGRLTSHSLSDSELQQFEPLPSASPDLDTGTAPETFGAGVSGPSFLGLDQTPTESNSLDYLYEDDAPGRRRGVLLAIILLAGFAAFIAYQWKQLPSWYTTIVARARQNQPTQQPQQTTSPSPTPASTTSAQPSPDAQSGQTQPGPGTQPAPAAAGDQIDSQNATPPAPTAEAGNPGTRADSHANQNNELINTANGSPAEKTSPATEDSGRKPGATPSSGDKTARADTAEDGAEPAAPDNDESADAAGTSNDKSRAVQAEAKARPPRDASEQLLLRGQAYLYGKGAPRSCDQALVYLRKAADLGNAHARSQLGALYATGHCVALDRARAYSWLTLAANATNGRDVWIERNRQMLWNEMTEAERARVRESMY